MGGGRAGEGAGRGKKCLARVEDANTSAHIPTKPAHFYTRVGIFHTARGTFPHCTGTLSFSTGTLSHARGNLPPACCHLPHACFRRTPITRFPLMRPRAMFCRAYASFIAICSSSVFAAPRGVARTVRGTIALPDCLKKRPNSLSNSANPRFAFESLAPSTILLVKWGRYRLRRPSTMRQRPAARR